MDAYTYDYTGEKTQRFSPLVRVAKEPDAFEGYYLEATVSLRSFGSFVRGLTLCLQTPSMAPKGSEKNQPNKEKKHQNINKSI